MPVSLQDQIVASGKQATVALLATLKDLTKQDEAQLAGFAALWGPRAAQWGIDLADAKSRGDEEAVARLTSDFSLLTDDAVLQLADAGEIAQGDTETAVRTMILAVAHMAGAAAFA